MVEDIGRIDAIVGQFIDYARSNQPPRAQRVDASEQIALLVDRYASEVRTGALVIQSRLDPGVSWHGDPIDLQRIVVNLIDNAIRHGRHSDTSQAIVDLSLTQSGGGMEIDIRDRGPGIPATRHEEALRPFARLDAARSDPGGTHAGTGLGLAIVARIVRRYGGSLLLSNAQGGGLRIGVQLPDWSEPA
jgi:two-component system osmolarity sensor histidine kinase EnvZ